MKKMIFTLMTMLTMSMVANAMSYEQARNEALFLTDKMAYELNLTDAQYEAAYEINLDYLMSVASRDDVFGTYWEHRNLDLSYILYSWQWDAFRAATYFYRPLYWDAGFWHFSIYRRYPHRDYFYFGRPHFYATYRGGHSWHFNGGRSYYYGRANHFRPALPAHREHFGMRNSFDRGDYRGIRGNSSTRITGRPGMNGNRNFDNSRSFRDNHGSNAVPQRSTATPQRSFGGSQSAPQRATGGSTIPQRSAGSQAPQRSFGGSSSAPQRSFGGGSSAPQRSAGSSSGNTRGSSGGGTQRSGGNGHFGSHR